MRTKPPAVHGSFGWLVFQWGSMNTEPSSSYSVSGLTEVATLTLTRVESPCNTEGERVGSRRECVIELRASRSHLSVLSSTTTSSRQRRSANPSSRRSPNRSAWGGEDHREGSGVMEDQADGVDDNLSDRPGVVLVVPRVRGVLCRAGRRQSAKLTQSFAREGALAKSNISPSALLVLGRREFGPVRGKGAYAIGRRRRPVRHHGHYCGAQPFASVASQLEPRGSQLRVVWRG